MRSCDELDFLHDILKHGLFTNSQGMVKLKQRVILHRIHNDSYRIYTISNTLKVIFVFLADTIV